MNKKENDIKLSLDRLHDMRVMLSRLYRDNNNLHKDIELLLFYIYEDWKKVKETIEIWREVEHELGDKNE